MSTARAFLNTHSVSAFLTDKQVNRVVDLLEDYATYKLRQHYSINQDSDDIKRKNKVIEVVKEFYNVDFLIRSRKREVLWPRQVACYLLRMFTDLSLREIAVALNYGDHSCVIHSITTVKNNCNNYLNFRSEVARVKSILE